MNNAVHGKTTENIRNRIDVILDKNQATCYKIYLTMI